MNPGPTNDGPYAEPRVVTDPSDCIAYHTFEVPGYGLAEGEWDLRGGEHAYLGEVELAGKRVLEVGTASGYLCFWMESKGADVVGYDLSEDQDWDVVPYASMDRGERDHLRIARLRKETLRRLNNGWWLVHRAIESKAKVAYGSAYEIPPALGSFDISTYGSILLHLRDPFLALYRGSVLTREQMIVTDLISPMPDEKAMHFWPDHRKGEPLDTWWWLSPAIVVEMLGVLGFEDTTVTHHTQTHNRVAADLFTVVGRRTAEFRPPT